MLRSDCVFCDLLTTPFKGIATSTEDRQVDNVTYIIWKNVEDRNVKDVNKVVGLFVGTYEEADALLEKLNAADPSVKEGLGRRKLYGYWRSEPTFITPQNLNEFLQF
jgi:hypothetical protein